ncbi:hypothetical protein Indivirus_4_39 [Indivirus ILV1]|uniref:C3H1-type domain-containing protein n=1 Tax=Indivirus ILV1 TaxID=1977633 RepID=A0A1V0SDS9_9VIRU|nr:hypothetical protein Indivirus_4_39 [Indivirus ILV1]
MNTNYNELYVENNKKILCFNMLNYGKCNYGNKCDYAHSLSDQKIEPLRYKAYSIIKATENLKNIDLIEDKKLYEALLQLTKMCSLCNKNLCPGGYNCRNGAINVKSKICYDDFMFGNCKRTNCLAVHLTKRGFVPYITQRDGNKQNHQLIFVPQSPQQSQQSEQVSLTSQKVQVKLNNSILDKYNYVNKIQNNKKLIEELNDIEGVLLTEKFLLARYNKSNNEETDSDTDDNEKVESIINYLNDENDSESSTDESIFLV